MNRGKSFDETDGRPKSWANRNTNGKQYSRVRLLTDDTLLRALGREDGVCVCVCVLQCYLVFKNRAYNSDRGSVFFFIYISFLGLRGARVG